MYLQHLVQASMGVEELLAALILLPHNLGLPSILGNRDQRKGLNAPYDLCFEQNANTRMKRSQHVWGHHLNKQSP